MPTCAPLLLATTSPKVGTVAHTANAAGTFAAFIGYGLRCGQSLGLRRSRNFLFLININGLQITSMDCWLQIGCRFSQRFVQRSIMS